MRTALLGLVAPVQCGREKWFARIELQIHRLVVQVKEDRTLEAKKHSVGPEHGWFGAVAALADRSPQLDVRRIGARHCASSLFRDRHQILREIVSHKEN